MPETTPSETKVPFSKKELRAFLYSLFDGILFAGPWWWRYYAGGFKKAEIIAANKLEQGRNILLEQIMNLVAQ